MPVIQEALTATAMDVTLFVGGTSRVGVGVSGTWAGTVSFSASTDGVNFNPVFMTPFASGTNVSSTTTTGNWFVNTGGFAALRCTFTRTSGTAIVKIAAGADPYWQTAFLAATTLYQNSTASGALNTLTITSQANRAWRLSRLVVTVDATATWASKPVLTIKDGTTILWAGDLTTAAQVTDFPLPPNNPVNGDPGGIVNTPGNNLVIACQSGGGAVNTNINAFVLPA
jgi:hypothetical protein